MQKLNLKYSLRGFAEFDDCGEVPHQLFLLYTFSTGKLEGVQYIFWCGVGSLNKICYNFLLFCLIVQQCCFVILQHV